MNAAIARRLAPLHHVLIVAADADADADAAALLATTDEQRLHGARTIAGRLDALGGLRPGLGPDDAAAILDVLIDPMAFRRLVVRRGWPFEGYVDLQQRIAAASLLA